MKPGPAFLLSLMAVLMIMSPSWSAGQDPASIYAPEGLGRWTDGETLQGAAMRVAHGPVAGLDPARDALLVVSPRLGYTEAEANAFFRFLNAGGRALIADDDGGGRSLLAATPVDIDASAIYSTSYARNPAWPIVESPAGTTTVLSRPHSVTGTGETLLAAHPFSWKDLDNDLEPDLTEPVGPWPVAKRMPIGLGELVVIGDAGVFFQGVSADFAMAQLQWLGADRTIVVDEGHRATADPIRATPMLSGAAPGAAWALGALVFLVAAWQAVQVEWHRETPPKARRQPSPLRREALEELPDPS